MDIKTKAKSKVLQELIDMMDEKLVGDLKGKSPKFAQVDIQTDDPKLANSIKDNLVRGLQEDAEDESEETTPADFKEDPKTDKMSSEDQDDIERLKELYEKLK